MFGIDEVGGLPLHVLMVHAAVVLVPLAAALLILTGWRQPWRRDYALPIALLAIAGAIAALIAAQSGETLQHQVQAAARAAGTRARFGDHPANGDTARIFAIVFAVAASGLWAVERWRTRVRLGSWAPAAVYAVSATLGLIAIVTVVIAGHSGSALVWRDLGNFVTTAGR